MVHLGIIPRFLVGWGESFLIKCIICNSGNNNKNPLENNRKQTQH